MTAGARDATTSSTGRVDNERIGINPDTEIWMSRRNPRRNESRGIGDREEEGLMEDEQCNDSSVVICEIRQALIM